MHLEPKSRHARAFIHAFVKFLRQFGRDDAYKATRQIAIVLLTGLSLLAMNLAGCGGDNEGGFVFPIVKSLTVTPVNPTIANGTPVQLTATGIFFDNTVHDLTTAVQWVSTAPQFATVGNTAGSKGLVTGRAPGVVPITAFVAGRTASTTVTVTSATLTSITITPPDLSIALGTPRHLIATANFSDGTTQDLTAFVNWVSSNSSVATVSNATGSQGLVTGSGAGSATITATFNGVSGSTTVTVDPVTLISITITPPNPTIAKGIPFQLTATGNFSDGSTQPLTEFATWSSSNPSVTVSNAAGSQGQVTGGAGSATITATFDGVSGSTTVTVTTAALKSIVVQPASNSIAKGTTVMLTADGLLDDGTDVPLTESAIWQTSDDGIADVSNAAGSRGLVTGTGQGSATITATEAGVTSNGATVTVKVLTKITVIPANPSIPRGFTQQLQVEGTFSDGSTDFFTDSADWSSSNNTDATVDSHGLVTGRNVGSAIIEATVEGFQGSTTVTVDPAVLVSIAVEPSGPSIIAGGVRHLTATGTFSDNSIRDLTTSASWISGTPSIATVDSMQGIDSGLVTGESAGTSTVTAAQDGESGRATVTVTTPPEFAYVTNENTHTVTAYAVNLSTGALTQVGTPALEPGTAPSAVTADLSGKFLYVTNDGSASVTVYSITQTDPGRGGLTLLQSAVPSAGNPFGISVAPSGEFAYVAHRSNAVSGYAIAPTAGDLTGVPGSPFSLLPSFTNGTQGIAVHPNNKYLYATTSGVNLNTTSNGPILFTFNPTTGRLNLPGTFFGAGAPLGPPLASTQNPVSLTVDPLGRFVYVANNLPPRNVSAYTVDFGTGDLTFVDNFPAGNANGGPAEVAVDPRVRFAYVAGGDVVTAFTIARATNGALTPTTPPTFATQGGTGGAFAIAEDPSAQFVYVANHGPFGSPQPTGGGIAGFRINQADGTLTALPGFTPNTLPSGPTAITVVPVP